MFLKSHFRDWRDTLDFVCGLFYKLQPKNRVLISAVVFSSSKKAGLDLFFFSCKKKSSNTLMETIYLC